MYIFSSLVKNISRGEYMKKRLVLKPFVLPTLYIGFLILMMVLATKALYRDQKPIEEKEYLSDEIIEEVIPVVNTEEVYVLTPYSGENVVEKIGYYNYQGDEESQEKSIVQYENTYLQNIGITYYSENDFDVIAIMDGTVTKIYDSELLGTIIEITHDNGIISVYQMVKNPTVKVDDKVSIGTVIATGGTSKLNPTGSNLYFEILKDGSIKDPKTIIGKNTKDI